MVGGIEYLKLENVSVGYGSRNNLHPVCSGLNFKIHAGSLTAVAGLNGAGKSTLLRTLAGLQDPLSGTIWIEGRKISDLSLGEIARRISIVLTEKVGGFNLTGYDVVSAGQMPYTDSFHRLKKEHFTHIEKAIDDCGIREYAFKPVNELSDGQFQKTMIAKALAQRSKLVLLDEPSAFLDYASKHELFKLLDRLAREEDKCILVSTHDIDLALKYCHNILLFANGNARLMSVAGARESQAMKDLTGGYL